MQHNLVNVHQTFRKNHILNIIYQHDESEKSEITVCYTLWQVAKIATKLNDFLASPQKDQLLKTIIEILKTVMPEESTE